MSVVFAVVGGAAGFAALLVLIVSFAAARSLVVGGAPVSISYRIDGDRIELAATELTLAAGSYGLIAGNGVHAQIGDVFNGDGTSVTRTLSLITGGHLPPRGEGRWVRDVYPSPAELGLLFTEVDIVTGGGISPAWVVPGQSGSDVWAIHLHGIRTTRSVVLPAVAALLPTGVTSLVPSWRGDSEGPPTFSGGSSLGQEEWRDVEAALEFAVASGARSIVLVGWSMGAMISTLLLENSRLADHIVAVVMVAPVTSWRAVVAHAVRAARLPRVVGRLVGMIIGIPGVCRIAGLAAPVHLAKLDGAASKVDVPTLVLHNAGDPLAPFAATVDFCRRNSEMAELVVFEDAPHAMEWNREPQKFEETINTWVTNVVASVRKDAGNGSAGDARGS